MSTIGFIGAGTVGTALATSLSERGYRVVAVASRSRSSAERLAGRIAGCRTVEDGQSVAFLADLVFVTTPDDIIASATDAVRWHAGQSVVHCSGAASVDILESARHAGAQVGGFHPLQTFASVTGALENLPGSTFAVEAQGPLYDVLAQMARDLDGQSVRLTAADKALYHAAAVIVSNYTVALMKMATELWCGFDVDTATATRALLPLLRGTVNNIDKIGLPDCLTGPIARGDIGTIRKHLAVLQERAPSVLEAYRALGLQAIPVALRKGKVGQQAAAEIEALLMDLRSGAGVQRSGVGRPAPAPDDPVPTQRTMLKSKIHRATVTEANVNYEGSISIDIALMEAAEILPFEQVHVLDVNNGARLQTYAIEGERGSGTIAINGAAARLIDPGDTVIILSYATVPEAQARSLRPRLVYVDGKNALVTSNQSSAISERDDVVDNCALLSNHGSGMKKERGECA